MKNGRNILAEKFSDFAAETEASEMDAAWEAIRHHLPVKRKRRVLAWIFLAGLFVSAWLITTEMSQRTLSGTGIESAGAGNPPPSLSEKSSRDIAEGSGPGQGANGAARPVQENPEHDEITIVPAKVMKPANNSFRNREAGESTELAIKAEVGSDGSVNDPDPEMTGNADHLNPVLFIGFRTKTNDSVIAAVRAIPRPHLLRKRWFAAATAGPALLVTRYQQGRVSEVSWQVAGTLGYELGRNWLALVSAARGGAAGEQQATSQGTEAIVKRVTFTSVSSSFDSLVGYREIIHTRRTTQLYNYFLTAGFERALVRRPRMGLSAGCGAGVQLTAFESETTVRFGSDTIVQKKTQTVIPISSVIPQPEEPFTQSKRIFYAAPAVRLNFRLGRSLWLTSRAEITIPLSGKLIQDSRKESVLNSSGGGPQQFNNLDQTLPPYPMASKQVVLSVTAGLSLRL